MITPYYKQFAAKTCIPEPVTLIGTFSCTEKSVKIISGGNDLKVGDYLYSTSNNQVRKVLTVQTPGIANIDSPFTANVVTPENLIIAGRNKFTTVSVSNEGGVLGKFNGNDFKAGKYLVFSDLDGVAPFTIYSGDTGQVVVWGCVMDS